MAATYRSYAAANAFLSLLEVVAYVAVGLGGLGSGPIKSLAGMSTR